MGSSGSNTAKTLAGRQVQRARFDIETGVVIAPPLMPDALLSEVMNRPFKRLDRRNKKDPVFNMLSKEMQDELLAYWNTGWYCSGALFRKWLGPDRKSSDGTYFYDCSGCCPFCVDRNTCSDYKCHIYNPMEDMSNCEHWISATELLLYYLDKTTVTDIDKARKEEYYKYFRGFHIPEEIDRYVDPKRNKPKL